MNHEDHSRTGIVVFAFGTKPVHGNAILGRIASTAASAYGMPVFSQGNFVEFARNVSVTRTPETAAKPWSSLRVARAAVEWAIGYCAAGSSPERSRLKKLIVVANPWHSDRAWEDLMDAVIERPNCDITILEGMGGQNIRFPGRNSKEWFDPASRFPQCRCRLCVSTYELMIRCLPRKLYRKIAS